jgi:cell division septum initiation protein DivIVA
MPLEVARNLIAELTKEITTYDVKQAEEATQKAAEEAEQTAEEAAEEAERIADEAGVSDIL